MFSEGLEIYRKEIEEFENKRKFELLLLNSNLRNKTFFMQN